MGLIYTNVTHTEDGLMSKEDKAAFDNLPAGAVIARLDVPNEFAAQQCIHCVDTGNGEFLQVGGDVLARGVAAGFSWERRDTGVKAWTLYDPDGAGLRVYGQGGNGGNGDQFVWNVDGSVTFVPMDRPAVGVPGKVYYDGGDGHFYGFSGAAGDWVQFG
jgi:hypothetical protein